MQNKWLGSGFIARDLETKVIKTKTGEDMTILNFSIGIKRSAGNGTDFIPCTAYGKNADNIAKYFSKGKGIEVEGRIQTGSYEGKNGKVYTTDVVVERWAFPPIRKDEDQSNATSENENTSLSEDIHSPQPDDFMNLDNISPANLPFKRK